jgi:REP element-mobilizing transposase RayT
VFYLITFTCYGARLHGTAAGSVDRNHNTYGAPLAGEDGARLRHVQRLMSGPYQHLGKEERVAVLEALKATCRVREWRLWAAHVRTNHVHAVVEVPGKGNAEYSPERVMRDLKCYASRELNRRDSVRKRWARHGSTKYLWDRSAVHDAIVYVCDGQGSPMERFVHPDW